VPISRPALLSAGRWAAVLVPAAELGLVLSGVLGVRAAVVVGIGLELLLAVVLVGEVTVFRRAYRHVRAEGGRPAAAAGAGFRAAWPPAVTALAAAELGLWRALWWAVRRRRDVGPDDRPLPYADRFALVTGAVVCLGALEVGVVHVLTARWPLLRWALFALGVYALLWMVSFGLSLRQRPHLLRTDELVLRFGHFRAIRVPLGGLRGVATVVVAGHRRSVVLEGDRLALPVMSDTNVELRFDPPVAVEVKGRMHDLGRIAFYADDPRSAVALLRAGVLSPER
jgi:hypothetical protein